MEHSILGSSPTTLRLANSNEANTMELIKGIFISGGPIPL